LYQGQLYGGAKHGEGKLFHPSAGVVYYEGTFKNNMPHASNATIYNKAGNVMFIGSLVNGKREGMGKVYHDNGELKYFGSFKNNKFSGEKCRIYYENGNIQYKGGLRDGKSEGIGQLYYESGA